MPRIEVKYDPSIELEPIEEVMYNTDTYEYQSADDINNIGEVEQTKMTGIISPLIKINNITINFSQVREFVLTSKDIVPRLSIAINDFFGLTESIDRPGADNIVRVQIIPPFENAYKKINLRFYINTFHSEGDILYLKCSYNVKDLYRSRLEAFGQITTYELADKLAKSVGLGLASNMDGIDDRRYMYCKNQSLLDLLSSEIEHSGTQSCIPFVWIDWFNYVTIADMWERYKAYEEEIKVWSMPETRFDVETGTEIEPQEIDAIITNSTVNQMSQLYTDKYNNINYNDSNVEKGTDKVIEYYHYNINDRNSLLIQDGDVKKDIYTKTLYIGEVFGDSNIQLQKICRDTCIQKMKNQCIKVSLKSPMLGLNRGDRVNVRWYDANDMIIGAKKDLDINTDVQEEDSIEEEYMHLNKAISGQYLILETVLSYKQNKMQWNYDLLLSRPADQVKTYGDDE